MPRGVSAINPTYDAVLNRYANEGRSRLFDIIKDTNPTITQKYVDNFVWRRNRRVRLNREALGTNAVPAKDKILKDLVFGADGKGGRLFGVGKNALFRYINDTLNPQVNDPAKNISRSYLQGWMARQELYSVMGPKKIPLKKTTQIWASKPFAQMSMDLADMSTWPSVDKRTKKKYMWLLVMLERVSGYIWVEPLTDKSAKTTQAGIKRILDRLPVKNGVRLQAGGLASDNGPEFKNAALTAFLNARGIKQWFSAPYKPWSNGASEAAVKSVKKQIRKYFEMSDNENWSEYLQKVVMSHNMAWSRRRDEAPQEIVNDWVSGASDQMFKDADEEHKAELAAAPMSIVSYKVGDPVRIALTWGTTGGVNWSRQRYRIAEIIRGKRLPGARKTMYELQVWETGEEPDEDYLDRRFDNSQIKPFVVAESTLKRPERFVINRIIRPVVLGGRQAYLISWLGYGPGHNSDTYRSDLQKDVPKILDKFEAEHSVKWTGVKFTWKK